jgi:hypothetical protein
MEVPACRNHGKIRQPTSAHGRNVAFSGAIRKNSAIPVSGFRLRGEAEPARRICYTGGRERR